MDNPSNSAPSSETSLLEVFFSPAEFDALARRDLSRSTCVVFDILRATSSMVTALANGAAAIVPVAEISEALAERARRPDVLLAGERNGFRIRRELTGTIDFDLGNSPREFTAERVAGKTIVMTTTNGTRALRACAAAAEVWLGAFLDLAALAERLRSAAPRELLLVCGGTHHEASFEDTLAAGALCDALWEGYTRGHIADSAQVARELYRQSQADLLGAMRLASNGRRLLGMAELAADVSFCLHRDVIQTVARLEPDGVIRPVA